MDKWLWHARFFKTRGLAAELVTSGKLRVNGNPVRKASYGVRAGDKLSFPQARQIRVVEILQLSERRGPAPEAQSLYHDLSPAVKPALPDGAPKPISGRPSKKDRRVLAQTRRSALE